MKATEVGTQSSRQEESLPAAIPIDPMTGKADWCVRSCLRSPDAMLSVVVKRFRCPLEFERTALNGEKYSDW